MRRAVAAGVAALGGLLLIGGCSRPTKPGARAGTGEAQSIQIKGSDTMVNLGQAWAEAFGKKTGAQVAVTGGGSGTGVAALINGTCDIAEASRKMEPAEVAQAEAKGFEPKEFMVALDGLAVVVNPANPVSKLTLAQLADIFTGKTKNWSEVGGKDSEIVLLSREVNSGTHVYFKEHVLRGGDKNSRAEFAAAALLQPSSQAIADEVAQNLKAIGYYGMGYLSSKQKALAVATTAAGPYVVPTPANVVDGSYSISRPLLFYTRGEPTGAVKEYLDFVLSPEGQKIVEEQEFVPVPKDEQRTAAPEGGKSL
jgi:phosphate transport system substrate-binding protein